MIRAVATLALGAGLFIYGGCDDGDDDGGGSGPAANCQERCANKLTSCGQDPQAAQAFCQSAVCNEEPTEAELSCAENKTCDDIAQGGADDCFEDDASDGGGGGNCPQLSGCECGISGVVMINGRCAQDCDEACAALEGVGGLP